MNDSDLVLSPETMLKLEQKYLFLIFIFHHHILFDMYSCHVEDEQQGSNTMCTYRMQLH